MPPKPHGDASNTNSNSAGGRVSPKTQEKLNPWSPQNQVIACSTTSVSSCFACFQGAESPFFFCDGSPKSLDSPPRFGKEIHDPAAFSCEPAELLQRKHRCDQQFLRILLERICSFGWDPNRDRMALKMWYELQTDPLGHIGPRPLCPSDFEPCCGPKE